MKIISVMIVEDSRVVREFLECIIERDPRLKVVASVGTGEEALRVIRHAVPDVISMDIRLPGMNGLELTKRIMTEQPTPIVVVSSEVEDEELKISMNALRAGALAVVQKPVGVSHADYEKVAQSLCTRLAIMSEVRVIRQRVSLRSEAVDVSLSAGLVKRMEDRVMVRRPAILGLVASTGGPSALVKVLNDLMANFPVPVVLVQHITPGFMRGFVKWLNEVVAQEVLEAEEGQRMEAGKVYVAPAECHLAMSERGVLRLDGSAMVSMQKPSGTVLFRSMAKVYGAEACGVLLTGMGEDGALGMRDIHEAGGLTIAEHASTAVVYGMPAAAVELGAVSEVLPLTQIGGRLNEVFGMKGSMT
ncbi:chemotaxis-specific protein-glutamate methyltransferase CheB [Phragmitibacter flavus]|nr:chemotaxis-specific protein-glutamate methyltransferase CheB [Phragmitibacter flavus]